jgi:hypothetical protein
MPGVAGSPEALLLANGVTIETMVALVAPEQSPRQLSWSPLRNARRRKPATVSASPGASRGSPHQVSIASTALATYGLPLDVKFGGRRWGATSPADFAFQPLAPTARNRLQVATSHPWRADLAFAPRGRGFDWGECARIWGRWSGAHIWELRPEAAPGL